MAVSAKVASAYIDLVARTEAFEKALGQATLETRKFRGTVQAEMREAKGSMMLLGEEIGVHIPRHLQTFIAKLPGVSSAMSSAFNAVAVFALIDIVFKAGEKIVEFVKKNEEAAKKNAAMWEESRSKLVLNNNELDLANIKLENQMAKLQKKPENKLAEALIEARLETEKLDEKLQAAVKDAQALLEKQSAGFLGSLLGKSSAGYEQTMLEQHGGWLQKAATPDAQLQESKSYAASLETRLAQLTAMQQEKPSYLDAGGQKRYLRGANEHTVFMSRGPVSHQPEIDATKELMTRQAIEQHLIEATLVNIKDRNAPAGLRGAASAASAGTAANPYAGIDRPNTSMFMTPVRDLARQLLADANADKAANIQGDAAAAAIAANDAWGKVAASQYSDIPGLLKGTQPNVTTSPISEFSKAASGATVALDDLAEQFTDTAAIVQQLVGKSLKDFNDIVSGIMSGQKHASFGELGQKLFQDASKSMLERGEGSLLKGFGFGRKADGSPENPFNVIMANGLRGAASSLPGAAGGGLMSILNNNDWFSSLFGGRVFGAGGIFGGGHALGGDVAAGVPIDVGEMGRERFVPSVPGRITPNSQMGGGNVWNIDARGTDPALTRENFQNALAATHHAAVANTMRLMQDRSRRVPA